MKTDSFDTIFTKKIFRIPDYQRGYAWNKEPQLSDFWADLINLPEDKDHYTGMITLREISKNKIQPESDEYWLTQDHGYHVYHIVDGQQRITTTIIFLQSIIEVMREAEANQKDEDIFLGSISLKGIIETYLLKIKPTKDIVRTYLFGYEEDNPSFDYLRHKIFGEEGSGETQETFYTLNLANAKKYFKAQLKELLKREDTQGIYTIYRKLTQRMHYNLYQIGDDFNIHVAFESMNNRGKKLSNLELLKNRLLFLTTLYTNNGITDDERRTLNEKVNDTWKTVYHQVGRNKNQTLNDDELLKAHWVMYFRYDKSRGESYIKDLLQKEFHPSGIYTKKETEVKLEKTEEIIPDDEPDDETVEETEQRNQVVSELTPQKIQHYTGSLNDFSPHWFNIHFPFDAKDYNDEEKKWLDKINRIGATYFRPLLVSLFLSVKDPGKRVEALKKIERFIFIIFRLSGSRRSDYQKGEYFKYARYIYWKEKTVDDLIQEIEQTTLKELNKDKTLRYNHFSEQIKSNFSEKEKEGFYSWRPLHYFLYEYELELSKKIGQPKINEWKLFITSKKDKISIEHVYPQVDTEECWKKTPTHKLQEYQKEDEKHKLKIVLATLYLSPWLSMPAYRIIVLIEKKQNLKNGEDTVMARTPK